MGNSITRSFFTFLLRERSSRNGESFTIFMHLLGEFGPCRHGNQELGSDWVNGWMLVENLVASTSKKGHYVKVNSDL